MPDRTPSPQSPTNPLIVLIVLSLLLTGSAIYLSLDLWHRQLDLLNLRRELVTRAATCPTTSPSRAPRGEPNEPGAPAPPEDPVQRDHPYLGEEGVDISPAMRVALQHLSDAGITSERAGDPTLLRPSTIHVVNLWAVWCAACKEEMPDFRDLFTQRASDWGENVRFVAVQVNDHSSPEDAYRAWSPLLPPRTRRLADRGQGAPFVEALRGGPERQPLFFDELPVTLVLDCNRRVRWAKFERLGAEDFRDLEARIDALRGELTEEGADPRCRRRWCGNGRCEAGEGTASNRCIEDCGPPPREPSQPAPVAQNPEAPALSPPLEVPKPACPATCARCTEDGRCIPKLQGSAPATIQPPRPDDRCGDGRCSAADGESSLNCCIDCGCKGASDCKRGESGWACVPRLKL